MYSIKRNTRPDADGSPAAGPAPFDLRPFIRKRKVNLRRMVSQIAGCVVTTQPWRGLPGFEDDDQTREGIEVDISGTFHFVYREVQAYLEETARDFTEEVHRKRMLYQQEACVA